MTRCGRGGVELAGVCALQTADVACVFNAGSLHAQADAEVGDEFFAGIANGVQHAFDAALTEAAGDENAVEAFQLAFVAAVAGVAAFEALGFDPGDAELEVLRERAVNERFFQGLVAVFILDVLADDGDRDLVLRVVAAIDEGFPLAEVGVGCVDAQIASMPGRRRLPGRS